MHTQERRKQCDLGASDGGGEAAGPDMLQPRNRAPERGCVAPSGFRPLASGTETAKLRCVQPPICADVLWQPEETRGG